MDFNHFIMVLNNRVVSVLMLQMTNISGTSIINLCNAIRLNNVLWKYHRMGKRNILNLDELIIIINMIIDKVFVQTYLYLSIVLKIINGTFKWYALH